MYSATVVVAITLATSYALYSVAVFPISSVPVFSLSRYSIYGSPSFLHLQVNASAYAPPAEFRIDNSSSLSGILRLTASGYSYTDQLCDPTSTTFFTVHTGSGMLSVSGSGTSWIDGNSAASFPVKPGWHEVVISNGSGCIVTLPGGSLENGPSADLASIPMQSLPPRSFIFLIPYYTSGHVATIVFDGATEVVGF